MKFSLKKFTALALTALMLLSALTAFPLEAFAQEDAAPALSGSRENYSWSFSPESGSLTVNGTGNMEDFNPTDVPWGEHGERITSVALGEGITSVGSYAFYGCKNLASVAVPATVTKIGTGAFEGCSALDAIEVPHSVTYVGNNALEGTAWYKNQPEGIVYAGKTAYKYKGVCPGEATIQEGVVSICDNCFFGKNEITTVNLPSSLVTIGNYAFSGCCSLTRITLAENVKSIGKGAFYGCQSLETAQMTDSVTSIGFLAFSGCSKLSALSLSVNITRIEECTFEGCSSLESVTISEKITYIGDDAFKDCASLKDMYYTGTKESWEATTVGSGNSSLTSASAHFAKVSPPKTVVELHKTSMPIYLRKTVKINPTVINPVGKTTYKSSNKKIATVNSSGTVKGIKKGTAKITVTNNGVSKIFTVTVKNPKLNKTKKTLRRGNTFKLKIIGKAGKATFKSGNKKVAKVGKAGKITAKKKGKTTITVKTSGITLKCKITVK